MVRAPLYISLAGRLALRRHMSAGVGEARALHERQPLSTDVNEDAHHRPTMRPRSHGRDATGPPD